MASRGRKKKKKRPFRYFLVNLVLIGILAFSFSYVVIFLKKENYLSSLKGQVTSEYLTSDPVKKDLKPKTKTNGFEENVYSKVAEITVLPEFSIPTSSTKNQLIKHKAFSLSYYEAYEQAEWVAYSLSKENLQSKKFKRKDNFKTDPNVVTFSAHPNDYKNSGYDRGHLAPAGDFTWFSEALDESFYMSNISPQEPAFNRGIWKKLEEQVRQWALENDKIFVVTGPVLNDGLSYIGKNKVAVPKFYYKIILDIEEPEYKAIGFIMPNARSDKKLSDFAVTIDSIESLTQLDFFPLLPDSLEERLEGKVDLRLWFK